MALSEHGKLPMTDPWDERYNDVYVATFLVNVYGKCR